MEYTMEALRERYRPALERIHKMEQEEMRLRMQVMWMVLAAESYPMREAAG